MGRRPKPIPDDAGPELRRLVLWLRHIKDTADADYRTLAARTGGSCSATTLSRAASGRTVPPASVVETYARYCDADRRRAASLWRAASAEAQTLARAARRLRPQDVSTPQDLRAALLQIRHAAGGPSLRALEEKAGPGRLPRSTLAEVLREGNVPRQQLLAAFLEVCGVPDTAAGWWQDARRRAAAARSPSPAAAEPPPRRTAPVHRHPYEAAEQAWERRQFREALLIKIHGEPATDDDIDDGPWLLGGRSLEFADPDDVQAWEAEATRTSLPSGSRDLLQELRAAARRTRPA